VPTPPSPSNAPPWGARPRALPAVGPTLRPWLAAVFGLFALLCVDSVYLGAITVLEAVTGEVYQNWFYLLAFAAHLGLGVLLVVPAAVFSIAHLARTRHRRNRRAVRAGYGLLAAVVVLLVSGLALVRLDGLLPPLDGAGRRVVYALHVIAPLLVIALFVLHRLAGPRLKWRTGARWAAVSLVVAGLGLGLHSQDPRQWHRVGSPEGARYFEPSLARTTTGAFIPADVLQDDECRLCHADAHATWARSAHRFSSFNNPAYLFSVRETRRVSLERDGDVRAARFCAGCHDPVPFFSGRFDDPDYDDVADPTAHAGITCTVCHAISHVNSLRGNADFTLDEPVAYPFTRSDVPALRWVGRQLVKARPALHKKTFLKPLHREASFCGTCHKVHLPEALNRYKWLRGQNHYDSFWQSGVSGHAVASFYSPAKAQTDCRGCHMPLLPSTDVSAAVRDDSGRPTIHDHLFPGANTALPVLTAQPDAAETLAAHEAFLRGSVRVDLFGLRADGALDGALSAPLRPALPALQPGGTHLVEVVVRTLRVGHHLTQGTADSNELWLEMTAVDATGRVLGQSGALDAGGALDPWAHRVNVYMLDRHGHRIDRRNAQDIFVPLYDNQIPPGAADAVHYRLNVPMTAEGPVTLTARLRYRKFDATFVRYFQGPTARNTLPVVDMASDTVTLPLAGGAALAPVPAPAPPAWERWNDYGIGLLRKARGRQLAQAEQAFAEVERWGRPEGPLNRARVYLQDGRTAVEAPAALAQATRMPVALAAPWTHRFLGALVEKENGRLDLALEHLQSLLQGGFPEAAGRGFDFSQDLRVQSEIGQTAWLLSQASPEGPARSTHLETARAAFERALAIDPEDLAAHWGLMLVHGARGDAVRAEAHRAEHARYKPDDNARDTAVARARQVPWANHAAEPVVVYELR
jgi:hypothetical protein